MDNAPALRGSAAIVDWSTPDNQRLLKETVARGTTPAEFAMFRELCIATGLNPFKREIWCIIVKPDDPKYRQVQIMTGINGYLAVANRNPAYDGMEWTWDLDSKGALVSATAKVYRKDRKFPSVGTALLKEFGKKYGNWLTMEKHMLLKCAKAIALREAFPQELGGTYIEEEMEREYSLEVIPEAEPDQAPQGFDEKRIEQTYLLMPLKVGTKAGTTLAEIDNGFHLENHFHKYREQYSSAQQEALAIRIDELKKQLKPKAPLEPDYSRDDSELPIEGEFTDAN